MVGGGQRRGGCRSPAVLDNMMEVPLPFVTSQKADLREDLKFNRLKTHMIVSGRTPAATFHVAGCFLRPLFLFNTSLR